MQLLPTSFAALLLSAPLPAQSAPIAIDPQVRVRVAPQVVAIVQEPAQVYRLTAPAGDGVWTLSPQEPKTAKQAKGSKEKESKDLKGPRPGDAWIGLSLRARADGPERLEVESVIDGSPADHAGVRAGDKLVALDAHGVATYEGLVGLLSGRHSGDKVTLTVERTVKAKLGASSEDGHNAFLGVSQDGVSEKRRSDGVTGVAVSVNDGTGADAAGMRAGDRIAAVGGVEVGDFEQLRQAIQSRQPGDGVELRIQRDLRVELAPRPSEAKVEPKEAPAPKSDDGGRGLFEPDKQQGEYFWANPDEPRKPKAPKAAPKEKVTPAPDAAPKPPKRRAPDADMTSQLLEEVRALRAEVAELRREIEALREQRR